MRKIEEERKSLMLVLVGSWFVVLWWPFLDPALWHYF